MISPPKGSSIKDLKRQSLKYNVKNDMNKIVDDFQINDDPAAKANQWAPAAAADNGGNSIVVWEDWRNRNRDIYAQFLDIDGKQIGTNFRINDDNTDAGQKDAAVIASRENGYIVVWRDGRNGNNDIYGQKISAAAQLIGHNFKIHESNSAQQVNPAIGQCSDGTFLVVWEDWRHGNLDIYARKLSTTGQPVAASFKINDDFTNADQTCPKVAFDGYGNAIVVWRDFRFAKNVYEGADIYAQYINNGVKLSGPNFMVNEKDGGTSDQCNPSITMSPGGDFFIVWRDNRNDNLDIFGQLFDSNCKKRGQNVIINDDKTKRAQRHPSVCINGRGEFMVVWADLRNENFDIYAQCFNVAGQRIAHNFRVNDAHGSPAVQNEPVVASDASGNLLLSWIDYRNMTEEHKSDVFAQRSYFDNILTGTNKTKPVRNLSTHQSN